MSINIKYIFSSSGLQILCPVNPCLNQQGQNREWTSESCSLKMSMTWDVYEENNSDPSVSVHGGCSIINSYVVHKPKLNLWGTENFYFVSGKNQDFPCATNTGCNPRWHFMDLHHSRRPCLELGRCWRRPLAGGHTILFGLLPNCGKKRLSFHEMLSTCLLYLIAKFIFHLCDRGPLESLKICSNATITPSAKCWQTERQNWCKSSHFFCYNKLLRYYINYCKILQHTLYSIQLASWEKSWRRINSQGLFHCLEKASSSTTSKLTVHQWIHSEVTNDQYNFHFLKEPKTFGLLP